MGNIELVMYLVERAAKDNVTSIEDLHKSIEEALKDRLNQAVKLVQEFDVNESYAELLKTFVFVKLKSKDNG